MLSKKFEQLFESETPASARSDVVRETYDERLAAILHAATLVIAREGYEKATMRAVASASGTSLAGLYHYFESKERMLFLIQFRAFNSLLNNLREKLHGVEDPVDQLRVMVRAHVEYFAANMAALKVCSHELESLSDEAYHELRSIRHAYYQVTRAIIVQILDRTDAPPGLDLHEVTMCLFGMLNWLYRWYDPRRGRSPGALANQITRQFLGGLLGAEIELNGEADAAPSPRKA